MPEDEQGSVCEGGPYIEERTPLQVAFHGYMCEQANVQKIKKPSKPSWVRRERGTPSYDKGGHKERSKSNQPNHNNHKDKKR